MVKLLSLNLILFFFSLGDVSWEIAVDRDTQDRLAVEVEQCSCPPGYTGLSCEDCAPGYERSGQGPYLGTCVPARQGPQCSAAGAISTQPSYAGTCQCKTYATGPLCDQCPPNNFNLIHFDSLSSLHSLSSRSFFIPFPSLFAVPGLQVFFRPQSRPQLTGRDITFSTFYETPGQTLYWKIYGGTLKYVFRYSGTGPLNGDPDVILRVLDDYVEWKLVEGNCNMCRIAT
uniref:Laminin EGF-like domain-containing protein n=1 Tax=Parascaris equorum TaxID=6256 RepID=A0A914RJH0_PAREQ